MQVVLLVPTVLVLHQEDGSYKVPQTGNVIIEDHVDIGANSVDRATLGSTRIGRGETRQSNTNYTM